MIEKEIKMNTILKKIGYAFHIERQGNKKLLKVVTDKTNKEWQALNFKSGDPLFAIQKLKLLNAVYKELVDVNKVYAGESIFDTIRSIKCDNDDYPNLKAWLDDDKTNQVIFANIFDTEYFEDLVKTK